MPYVIRYILFLLAALAVSGVLGYLSGYLGKWALVVVVLVMIPVTIGVGEKVLKRDTL